MVIVLLSCNVDLVHCYSGHFLLILLIQLPVQRLLFLTLLCIDCQQYHWRHAQCSTVSAFIYLSIHVFPKRLLARYLRTQWREFHQSLVDDVLETEL